MVGAVWPRLPAPLLELARLIDDLRAALGGALGGGGGELVAELAELQLLRYAPGGFYGRHLDAGRGGVRLRSEPWRRARQRQG